MRWLTRVLAFVGPFAALALISALINLPGSAVLFSEFRCGPDAAPAPAAAAGLTCEVFYDTFTSLATIDTTNSKAPGFKWYVGNKGWPWFSSTSITSVPATWYSVGAGGLTINPLVDDVIGESAVNSCVSTGAVPRLAGDPSVGFSISGPFYLRSEMTYPTTGSNVNAWPIVWLWPLESTAGVTVVEVDNHEFHRPSGTSGFRLHYWHGGTTVDSTMIEGVRPPGTIADVLFTGTGMTIYNNAASPTSIAIPDSDTDVWTLLNAQHNCINLGGGMGEPTTFAQIKVWQAKP